MMQLKNDQNQWRSDEDERLAVFLWNRLDRDGFHHPAIITLYARASGADSFYSRNLLENACFTGGDQAQFSERDFNSADLSGGHYPGAVFNQCDFTGADLRNSILSGAQFAGCHLSGACFDQAELAGVTWKNCSGLNELDTEPVLYEQIIDHAEAQHWELSKQDIEVAITLMKAYKTILNKHVENKSLTKATELRLNEKAWQIRAKIYPA